MFIGKYYYTLESKGRVSLPSAFRSQEQNWILTRGLDGAIFLFPESTYQEEVQKLSMLSANKKAVRDAVRLLSNDATAVSPDKIGRITVPEYLITAGNLDKELVIVGSISKVEIWNRNAYHLYMENLSKTAEETLEQLAA